MSETQDTPKFTVINRRKWMESDADASESVVAQEEDSQTEPVKAQDVAAKSVETPRPKLVEMPDPEKKSAVESLRADAGSDAIPTGPSSEESRFQKAQYEQSAERLETLVRAQNPGAPAMEKIGFEHLVQQLYLSALMQMGAGTPEGQRPRVDILGARQTIDLLGVLQEKTAGNLTKSEQQTLETALYELRMTFLELTRMISMQPPPPPGGAKH